MNQFMSGYSGVIFTLFLFFSFLFYFDLYFSDDINVYIENPKVSMKHLL